jgi:hypothetical protein
MFFKQLILLVSFVSMTGCTSMRAVEMEQTDFAQYIETGDHLVIYEKGGRILDIQVARVENTTIYGSITNAAFSTVEIEMADVERIEIEKVSGAKTAGVIAAGVVLIPIFVAFAGMGLAAQLSSY